jgi:hypothetical protein
MPKALKKTGRSGKPGVPKKKKKKRSRSVAFHVEVEGRFFGALFGITCKAPAPGGGPRHDTTTTTAPAPTATADHTRPARPRPGLAFDFGALVRLSAVQNGLEAGRVLISMQHGVCGGRILSGIERGMRRVCDRLDRQRGHHRARGKYLYLHGMRSRNIFGSSCGERLH